VACKEQGAWGLGLQQAAPDIKFIPAPLNRVAYLGAMLSDAEMVFPLQHVAQL
jgi:hypothetical protein